MASPTAYLLLGIDTSRGQCRPPRIWPRKRKNRMAQVAATQLPTAYRAIPGQSLFSSRTRPKSYDLLVASIPRLNQYRIVDFGCGPSGGLAEVLGRERVIPYDPSVGGYDAPPWDRPFDVFFSSEVLEHMPLAEIRDLCVKLLTSRPLYIFLTISTGDAEKTFPDRTNVHLTVKPTTWWRNTFDGYWSSIYRSAVLREKRGECTLMFRRQLVTIQREPRAPE